MDEAQYKLALLEKEVAYHKKEADLIHKHNTEGLVKTEAHLVSEIKKITTAIEASRLENKANAKIDSEKIKLLHKEIEVKVHGNSECIQSLNDWKLTIETSINFIMGAYKWIMGILAVLVAAFLISIVVKH